MCARKNQSPLRAVLFCSLLFAPPALVAVAAAPRASGRIVLFCCAALAVLLTAALGYLLHVTRRFRDISRRQQEQLALVEKFRTILYSIGDAVIATDDQGRVLQMNPVAEHLTGWTETEALGKPLADIFHIVNEETRAPVENPALRVLREGKTVGLANHTVLIARDGTERPIADSGAPVCDKDSGTLSGVVLVFRDQSAEHAAQKALRESEAQYSDLFHNMAEGFALHEIICNGQGQPVDYRFLKVNPAFEQLTGLRAEQIIGRRVLEVLPEKECAWIEKYGVVALKGKTLRFENFSASLNRHYRVTAFSPRPGQFCTLFDDITDRKQAEAEQANLREQFHQSQKLEAIGRLAGGIAHDFNNRLAIILGNAEIGLEETAPDSPLHSELNEIAIAGKHSAELVKQLLAFASRQMIMPKVVNLNAALSGMLPMLRRLISEEIVLDWHPGAELWDVWIDPNQLEQLIINLTANARDAITGTGQISIATCNVPDKPLNPGMRDALPSGDYVQLSITDTGCGMDDATQAHLFEPFFTTKQHMPGSGFGLPTVYGILKQNKGDIRVTSKPGKGTCFSFYLPRHTVTPPAPGNAPGRAGMPTTPEPSLPPACETILLVEDEAELLRLVRTLLTSMGYAVLSAYGPAEALSTARTFTGDIHLLLTDVVMPEMSGYDLWEKLRLERQNLKCLYMSGYTDDIIARHGVIKDNSHTFIQKPFSKAALAEKVREALSV